MRKTMDVVTELADEGCTYWRLVSAMRGGKITPLPARDCSGDFIWSDEDLERARAALQTDLRRKKAKVAK